MAQFGAGDSPSAAPVRRVFIHAGLPKTGTSYLQSVLWNSKVELLAQDVSMQPVRRRDHLRVVLKVRNMFKEFDNDWVRACMERLQRGLENTTASTVIFSHESLAPARPEHARELVDAFAGFEPHLVLTVRDPAKQIPSAWQQRMQGRETYTYEEFLDAVFARTALASDFWWNQDVEDVLARWSKVIPPEHIHVITCPPSGAERRLLLSRFCSVVGLDPATLHDADATSNISLGQPQAELLRRVNVALGDRFPDLRSRYWQLAQVYLAGRILRPQAGRPARLPVGRRAEVEALCEEWIRYIEERGFDVVGDLDELRPRPDGYETAQVEIGDSELLEVAVRALADVLENRDGELDERNELKDRVKELEDQLRHARSGRGAARSLARRVIRGRSSSELPVAPAAETVEGPVRRSL
ncbi:MAG: hypothetical protein J7518_13380 [Nocardioidaceae bacterium]|nr:hypothetical protein [Nocardioidaceae bacterium]